MLYACLSQIRHWTYHRAYVILCGEDGMAALHARHLAIFIYFAILTIDSKGFLYRSTKSKQGLFRLKKTDKRSSNPFETKVNSSFQHCVKECLQKSSCKAISYKRNAEQHAVNCLLSTKLAEEGANFITSAKWKYYEPIYYDACQPTCSRYTQYCKSESANGPTCKALQVVSRAKSTAQSSTGAGGYSSRAVDGGKSTSYHAGTCTHTVPEAYPWWRVDLGSNHFVGSVEITNRGDCCHERFKNAEIRIGMNLITKEKTNPLCTSALLSVGLGQTGEFPCDFQYAFGRYVNVILQGSYETLTLCEVEVFGIKV